MQSATIEWHGCDHAVRTNDHHALARRSHDLAERFTEHDDPCPDANPASEQAVRNRTDVGSQTRPTPAEATLKLLLP